ncbi:Y4yA family PLP-dependent enzyme [Streptomyces sp. NBC_01433]|uniref:Y4yA family PLP-dependent enzyme n=1 Tax=Streptomyces sp. NBC_01433 TaxID=2903864 RepID=UPI0022540894|nr:Y4yA family PLP-dependent enzyme [Streptomyces sp. NBC_01433]MCX4679726.1 Y4yA family PLP-dependent enzyme [Streptomyces sp. NBC_01433]
MPLGRRVPSLASPLYLEPRLEPRPKSLLASAPLLHSLVDGLGSPLNVVLPDQVAENVSRFRSLYRRHRLGGDISFAHKANRSSALVRRLAATGAAMDVASLHELQHAMACGFTADRISATGPKEPEFLWLAARTGVTVNVEGRTELEALAALVRGHGLAPAKVLLRLSDFAAQGVKVLSRRSRFGSPAGELSGLLDAAERHRDAVEIIGVAFHLDTTSLDEKAVAMEGCIRAMDECRARGMHPRVLDIGGGFGVNYLAHKAQWEDYTTQLTLAALGRREALTWRDHRYGLSSEAGTLRGALELYPSHRPVAGVDYLDELLRHPAPSLGRPLATLLLESLYDLCVEPGRALVDQCGLTLARVLEVRGNPDGVRGNPDGSYTVRLAMNADDCALEEHGILMDPVLLDRGGPSRPSDGPDSVGVYLHGNLCLESDLITRRMVFLPRRPVPGDLLAFANTAGYCMDFNAQNAQQRPSARKVALYRDTDGWQWSLDDQYWPIHSPGDAREI